MSNNLTAMPQNYKKNVDWIIGAYEDSGVQFPDGFQKDAIQNSVGARKTNKWDNFKCEINVINNSKGTFLVIEDSGTLGLIGDNLSALHINLMMEQGETLDSNQRLARFSSMFNSGGNSTGGGLYGAGKSVYSVASNDYIYYYDSLTSQNKYVANINKCGSVMEKALEGNEAKKYIYNETGIKEKTTVGTRVIISNPKEELLRSIKSKELIKYIQISWWRIIERMSDDSGIYVNGEKVLSPKIKERAVKTYELPTQDIYVDGYKIKHFGLYVFENVNDDWNGISYYRKGMKIGEIDIKDIPEKLIGKIWGYVEVDDDWEDELAEIEDKIHFGVSKGKKGKMAYQYLKRYCDLKVNEQLVEWGYIKNNENINAKLQEKLEEIADNVQSLFDKIGISELEKNSQKADFNIRWQNVVFPECNSQKVTTGDHIKFSSRVTGTYSAQRKAEYLIVVKDIQTDEIISEIGKGKFNIGGDTSVWTKDFDFTVSSLSAKQYSQNSIFMTVKVGSRIKSKIIDFCYDYDKPVNIKEYASLSIDSISLPNNSRRVNFDEVIKDICYLVDNKRNVSLKFKLNVSVHNASDKTNPIIENICSISDELLPFESKVIKIPDIKIDKKLYSQYLEKGLIEIRARLLANEDSREFEKGDRITKYNYSLTLNMNEKKNRKDAFIVKSYDMKDKPLRSWHIEDGNNKIICINIGHAAYLKFKDYEDFQSDYLQELLLKEYLQLYLDAGKFDIFNDRTKIFSEAEPQEAVYLMLKKIEELYYESLK